jgi:uncharacterized protein (TIGR02598 family)
MKNSPELRVEGKWAGFGCFNFSPSAFSRSSSAFSLVEVIIAMGIAAFCLIAMLGLIPSGLRQVKISSEQTAASAILASVANDIRNTPPGSTKSVIYGITIPQSAENSSTPIYINEDGAVGSSPSSARYALKASLVSSNNASTMTTGNLVIWWPAAAALGNAQGSVETVMIFNQN